MRLTKPAFKYGMICGIFYLLFCWNNRACAQTTIYFQTFNTDTAPSEWLLNTGDLGGDDSDGDNRWIINNVYAGGGSIGVTSPTTPNEPAGITGYPQSYYLHLYSYELNDFYYVPENNNIDAGIGGNHSYFVAEHTPLITTGYDSVSLSFWWLCAGESGHVYGSVYYRTTSGGAWTLITTPITEYYDSVTWTKQSIHLPAFDNQATLEFGFQFNLFEVTGAAATGFAIDDIKVTGDSVTHHTTPPSAISALPGAGNIQVYPNPATDELFIAHAANGTMAGLFDIQGRQVYNGIITGDKEIIKTGNLTPGTYLLQLTDKNGNKDVRNIVKE